MIVELLLVLGGLALLVLGGDLLVKGAVGLSLKLGMTPLVVGLTVVAFGTSAPETDAILAISRRTSPGPRPPQTRSMIRSPNRPCGRTSRKARAMK